MGKIKVTIIRNAAGLAGVGLHTGTTDGGERLSSITYGGGENNVDLKLPTGSAHNQQDIYDLSRPHKVINVMNFYSAPSKYFAAYERSDMDDQLPLDAVLEDGDHLVVVWAPLLDLRRKILFDNLSKQRFNG